MINITLNGENKQIEPSSVARLLDFLKLDTRKIAIERNLEIVPRSQYENVILNEGDNIEIVAFIGGG